MVRQEVLRQVAVVPGGLVLWVSVGGYCQSFVGTSLLQEGCEYPPEGLGVLTWLVGAGKRS